MDNNHKKHVGQVFLRRLQDVSQNPTALEATLSDYASSPLKNRRKIANGLLAIGADCFESTIQRSVALAVPASLIVKGGLQNENQLEQQLFNIVGGPKLERSIQLCQNGTACVPDDIDSPSLLKSALLALISVNRPVALRKLDQLISQYGESQIGWELRGLRSTQKGVTH